MVAELIEVAALCLGYSLKVLKLFWKVLLADSIHLRLAFVLMFLGKLDLFTQLADYVNIRFRYDTRERCLDDILAGTIAGATMYDLRQFRRITYPPQISDARPPCSFSCLYVTCSC